MRQALATPRLFSRARRDNISRGTMLCRKIGSSGWGYISGSPITATRGLAAGHTSKAPPIKIPAAEPLAQIIPQKRAAEPPGINQRPPNQIYPRPSRWAQIKGCTLKTTRGLAAGRTHKAPRNAASRWACVKDEPLGVP